MNAIFEKRHNPYFLIPFLTVVIGLIGLWCICSCVASNKERNDHNIREQDLEEAEKEEMKLQNRMYSNEKKQQKKIIGTIFKCLDENIDSDKKHFPTHGTNTAINEEKIGSPRGKPVINKLLAKRESLILAPTATTPLDKQVLDADVRGQINDDHRFNLEQMYEGKFEFGAVQLEEEIQALVEGKYLAEGAEKIFIEIKELKILEEELERY